LNERQARYLLSYAAQQASGISCWMRDAEHIEKAFDFGGMPARNGVTAATMVAQGFTGVDDVFAGERNFFVAHGRPANPEEMVRGLGADYEILRTNIKRWSVGSPIQAPLDSLLELIKSDAVKAEQVEKLTIRVAHRDKNTTDDRPMPDINMQHMCAVMLMDGTVTFKSSHDEKRFRDPKVVEFRKKIDLQGDDALTKTMPARQAIVELALRDGRTLRHHTVAVRGTAENPMSRAEVDAKSYDLIAPIAGKARARRLCDAVWHLESLKDVRKLRPLLQEKP
jgi:2-methylcitrate dehydratase PrpD